MCVPTCRSVFSHSIRTLTCVPQSTDSSADTDLKSTLPVRSYTLVDQASMYFAQHNGGSSSSGTTTPEIVCCLFVDSCISADIAAPMTRQLCDLLTANYCHMLCPFQLMKHITAHRFCQQFESLLSQHSVRARKFAGFTQTIQQVWIDVLLNLWNQMGSLAVVESCLRNCLSSVIFLMLLTFSKADFDLLWMYAAVSPDLIQDICLLPPSISQQSRPQPRPNASASSHVPPMQNFSDDDAVAVNVSKKPSSKHVARIQWLPKSKFVHS